MVTGDQPAPAGDSELESRSRELRFELCRRLPYCPEVSPTLNPGHGVWVELLNPLNRCGCLRRCHPTSGGHRIPCWRRCR